MGSRNETNPSYWVTTTAEEPEFPPFPSAAAPVDVLVVGGGITGLLVATRLAEDGADVMLIEAGRLAAGVTGYTTAKVTALHGLVYASLRSSKGVEATRTYAEANQAGLAEIERLVRTYEIACDLNRLPAFTYTTDSARVAEVEAEVEAATEAGFPASFTTDIGLPYAVAGAVRVEDQAQFHPRRFCLGLAQALAAKGVRIHERTRALEVERGQPHTVKTEHGLVRANHVVLATQLPFYDPGGFFARATPIRSYAMVATLTEPVPEGMYLGVDTPTRSIRPVVPGGVVGIFGGEGHKVGQGGDTRKCYESLESWVRDSFPVEQVENRWSAQDYVPIDRVPYIGRIAGHVDRVYVATGFKKWGFTHAAVAARIIADLVAGRDNPWLPVFDATRLLPTAEGVKTFVKENLNVAGRFVGDRLATRQSPSAADLPAGEGAIADLDGEKVAAYRDDDGHLHAVSARCTHLGCLVAWNPAEKTWDCPCHGSRFTTDGTVIQGPAVRDLEGVE